MHKLYLITFGSIFVRVQYTYCYTITASKVFDGIQLCILWLKLPTEVLQVILYSNIWSLQISYIYLYAVPQSIFFLLSHIILFFCCLFCSVLIAGNLVFGLCQKLSINGVASLSKRKKRNFRRHVVVWMIGWSLETVDPLTQLVISIRHAQILVSVIHHSNSTIG